MNTHNKAVKNLLHTHDLRITTCRQAVLALFLEKGHAFSQPELERELGEQFDRVTLYRTLSSFEEAGLLHKVPDEGGTSRFVLCSGCGAHAHTHEHVHFKCCSCGNTLCIENLRVPHVSAPDGYTFQQMNYLVQGICPECNRQSRS